MFVSKQRKCLVVGTQPKPTVTVTEEKPVVRWCLSPPTLLIRYYRPQNSDVMRQNKIIQTSGAVFEHTECGRGVGVQEDLQKQRVTRNVTNSVE